MAAGLHPLLGARSHRLERAAGLCHRHPALAEAVLSGALSLSEVDTLGRAATDEREPWLADSLDALLRLNRDGRSQDWGAAVRHWAGLVDQEREVRQIPRHSITMPSGSSAAARSTPICPRPRS